MIGGVITAAIVVAGTSVGTFHTFPELATSLAQQLGPGGSWALGIGLFAAGFSSAITAPYASSIIASTVLGWEAERRLRWVWGTVLLVGFLFGISGVKPIPVILTVQALNGLILPLLVVLLIAAVNQRALIPAKHLPGLAYNVVLLVLLGSVVLVGLNQVMKTFVSLDLLSQRYFHGLVGCSGLLVAGMGVWLYRVRTRSS
jgi:Mn2+/Fe2+ NRAMP family transporter